MKFEIKNNVVAHNTERECRYKILTINFIGNEMHVQSWFFVGIYDNARVSELLIEFFPEECNPYIVDGELALTSMFWEFAYLEFIGFEDLISDLVEHHNLTPIKVIQL